MVIILDGMTNTLYKRRDSVLLSRPRLPINRVYVRIYEIGLDRGLFKSKYISGVSELNALGFPVLGMCTSFFPLHGPFYFSCEHLRLLVSSSHTHFLLPAISFFFSTRNSIALYPLGYSRTISCETALVEPDEKPQM